MKFLCIKFLFSLYFSVVQNVNYKNNNDNDDNDDEVDDEYLI